MTDALRKFDQSRDVVTLVAARVPATWTDGAADEFEAWMRTFPTWREAIMPSRTGSEHSIICEMTRAELLDGMAKHADLIELTGDRGEYAILIIDGDDELTDIDGEDLNDILEPKDIASYIALAHPVADPVRG